MAYTIVKSDGTVLTTIPDGTINTTSTPLGLPGRNYAGYGQSLDTNFTHMVENFADSTPPANPLRGQLWYDTNNNALKVCPSDGETNASAWSTLTSTSSGGATTFSAVTVTGNLTANNITATNNSNANAASFNYLTVSASANIADGNITTANIGTLRTQAITTGGTTTAGTLTGTWTATGTGTANGVAGTTVWMNTGNLVISGAGTLGIKVANANCIMDLTGNPITYAGTYNDSNVQAYLPTYTGNLGVVGGSSVFNGRTISTGANTTTGSITGNWTLTSGSRLNATYADLAERFEADRYYDAGTVVELGGEKEITAVQYELSDDVFGVVSETAGYLMNAGAGDNNTHPPIAVGGRVKVKVTGKVKKGQRLVSAGNGMARAAEQGEATAFNIIGRSLENKNSNDIGTVEAFVKIN
jgi:hypothetical protein